ncbi:hypothetical protein M404DRAFT_993566 [Pisolithus tinctorius Marx 270]|uniref:Uncharacterized protein n=1 Tax=Pisolithus tinctorius Marx 270 TaxID=870435 RepID=A0A0C3PUS0_PISTI|nr:hypothetical protein M404DRAFT_993566 [Pisolithus tinctorius Marx 270]
MSYLPVWAFVKNHENRVTSWITVEVVRLEDPRPRTGTEARLRRFPFPVLRYQPPIIPIMTIE